MATPKLTADEVMRMLRSDPEYMARNAEKERRRDEHIREVIDAMQPILVQLRQVGIDCDDLQKLGEDGKKYPAAVPILIEALPRVQNVAVKEIIVRRLTVPWARPAAAKPLIEEFHRTPRGAIWPPDGRESLRWAIGNALSVVAHEDVADELIAIATNFDHGEARQMFVVGLGQLRKRRPVVELMQLLDDPIVMLHAMDALGVLKAVEAKDRLQGFLFSTEAGIRREAKKALRKIEKAGS